MITYTVHLDKIDEVLFLHRKFLQEGYDKNILLFSGPRNPRTGGIVAARGSSIDEIKNFFSNDPYALKSMASYEIIEFDPVKHQDFLSHWIDDK